MKRKTPLKRTGFKPRLLDDKLSQLKPRKRMKQKSAKRVREEKDYRILRSAFLLQHPACEVDHEDCTRLATEIHHKAGRYEFYLRPDTFLACCHNGHVRVTREGEWARKMGYTLTPEQRRLLG